LHSPHASPFYPATRELRLKTTSRNSGTRIH
jgi:hypothetical protein